MGFNKQVDRFLAWPLNRDEALQQLDAFIAHGLPNFGDFHFEDGPVPNSVR